MGKGWVAAVAGAAIGVGCVSGFGSGFRPWQVGESGRDVRTGAAMEDIAAALRVALPLSVSEERFGAPENQPVIEASLARLRDGAHELESHGKSQDASFAYLSRSLASDAEEIKRRFDEGRRDETRFLLGALVEDCVGCHSRLPSADDSDLGRALFEAVDASGLSPVEAARLKVATRQFEEALEAYEAILADPAQSPAQLDLDGILGDYLTLAIRVRGDLPRARDGLEAFAGRADLPSYLATLIHQWIEAADTLRETIVAEPSLDRAERVLEIGDTLSRYGRDRAGLVHQLVASSLLLRFVDAHPQPGPDAAQAYFLLGVVELRSGRSTWLSEGEGYLEAAIYAAPGSDWGKRAYVLLEEQTLASYSGSGGVHVPPQVRRRLAELRKAAVGKE
jgi:tetratricopeptide (TPR) repeat protein